MKQTNLQPEQTQPAQEAPEAYPSSIAWQVGKVLFFFLLVLLSIYAVKALTTDIVLETQDAVFKEAYFSEIKTRESMESAIIAHEQSQVTLCKAYTSLRAYKQLKNIKLTNPEYNPCLLVVEKQETKKVEGGGVKEIIVKKDVGEDQQRIVRMMAEVSNNNMDFLTTMNAENGLLDMYRKHPSNTNGTTDYACGLNSAYHKPMIDKIIKKEVTEKEIIKYCYDVYIERPTAFYGYKKRANERNKFYYSTNS